MGLEKFFSINLSRVSFDIEMKSDYTLPPFPGSMLRGAWGRALKDISCCNHEKTCFSCGVVETCAYSQIVEPTRLENGSTGSGPRNKVPPYIINWERNSNLRRKFKMHFTFFNIKRIFILMAILALDKAIKKGIGRRKIKGKITPEPDELNDEVFKIINNENLKNIVHSKFESLSSFKKFHIILITPLRLVKDNKILKNFDYDAFINSILRRINLLQKYYGSKDNECNFFTPAFKPEGKISSSWITFKNLKRRSMRHGLIPAGGLIGEAVIDNPSELELMLLCSAEIIHVGKMASFGFGKIKVQGI